MCQVIVGAAYRWYVVMSAAVGHSTADLGLCHNATMASGDNAIRASCTGMCWRSQCPFVQISVITGWIQIHMSLTKFKITGILSNLDFIQS
jgi:hypothetical protein